MTPADYVADTSVFARLAKPAVAAQFAPLAAAVTGQPHRWIVPPGTAE